MTELDLLVLGSGVAGLTAAVSATQRGLRVGVLSKARLEQATTRWAQGGVAASLGGDPDSTDLHLADTLRAGAGLCDEDAVRVLVEQGPARVTDLIALGAIFDRDEQGRLLLAREGGHSLARVVHAGGAATGAEIERALVEAVRQTAAALFERCFALDLVIENGRCAGVRAADADGHAMDVRASHVLLATGGAGQLFAVTTNPVESTGDGVAMALRAGVAVADVEFVQFHPTALHYARAPRPLLSEALRGHGALLRDMKGERFVDELQPRDVVSRAMTAKMLEQGVDHLWLDATGLERFAQRFPTLAADLAEAGLDPARDWLPIAPAAHYLCGGVVTDLRGATSVCGLWAAGEVADTGVHGANRLASNSLLEGMVFGGRVVDAIAAGVSGPEPSGALRAVLENDGEIRGRSVEVARIAGVAATGSDAELRDRLARSMTRGAGVLRSAASLAETAGEIDAIAAALEQSSVAPRGSTVSPHSHERLELRNLATVARALLASAVARTESRGAHTRTDYPSTDPSQRARYVVRMR